MLKLGAWDQAGCPVKRRDTGLGEWVVAAAVQGGLLYREQILRQQPWGCCWSVWCKGGVSVGELLRTMMEGGSSSNV